MGIGDNVDFENDIVNDIKGRIICVDHTVNSLPRNSNRRLEHIKKRVSDTDDSESITLEKIISLLGNEKNLSLKMDIEGWEFVVLSNISDRVLELLI